MYDLLDAAGEGDGMGLGGQLALFMALFALGPLVISNYVGYTTSRQLLRDASLHSVEHGARLAATKTDLFVKEKGELVPSLTAGNRDLKEPIARLIDGEGGDGGARADLAAHLEAKVRETGDAVGFVVLGPDGEQLESAFADEKASQTAQVDACQRTVDRSVDTSLFDTEDRSLFLVRQPLAADGRRLGNLCAIFRFAVRREFREVASRNLPGSSFRIVDGGGEVLSGPGGAADGAASDGGAVALVERIGTSGRWTGKYTAADGTPRLAAVVPVDRTNWYLIAEVAEAQGMAPLRSLRDRALLFGALFVAIVTIGIGYTVRRFVGPISELLGAIRDMEQGELEQSVDPRGPKDVRVLASHFNDMSRRVAELQNSLEERVRERTAQLRESQAFNELLIDSMDDNLLVVDRDRRIRKVNAAARETHGDDLVGQSYYDVVRGEEASDEEAPLEVSFRDERADENERVHRHDGRAEIMKVQTFPLPEPSRESDDAPSSVLVKTRRISEEKRRQAQLVHSEKMAAYGVLAAGVAHEVGNPLSSIKSQLQRARMVDDEAVVDETLEVVEGEVERIERLLRQITGVARRQESRQHLVSPNQVAEDALQLLRHNPDSRKVDFELEADESTPPIRADEDRLLQVLLNLGINAVAAIDGAGRVRIETGCTDGCVRIRVCDDGPGVPEEVRDRIFEPYFTTKPAGEGTGLGLFVCSRIIEEMGGAIRYLEGAASGATFEIQVPAAEG